MNCNHTKPVFGCSACIEQRGPISKDPVRHHINRAHRWISDLADRICNFDPTDEEDLPPIFLEILDNISHELTNITLEIRKEREDV